MQKTKGVKMFDRHAIDGNMATAWGEIKNGERGPNLHNRTIQ